MAARSFELSSPDRVGNEKVALVVKCVVVVVASFVDVVVVIVVVVRAVVVDVVSQHSVVLHEVEAQ